MIMVGGTLRPAFTFGSSTQHELFSVSVAAIVDSSFDVEEENDLVRCN